MKLLQILRRTDEKNKSLRFEPNLVKRDWGKDGGNLDCKGWYVSWRTYTTQLRVNNVVMFKINIWIRQQKSDPIKQLLHELYMEIWRGNQWNSTQDVAIKINKKNIIQYCRQKISFCTCEDLFFFFFFWEINRGINLRWNLNVGWESNVTPNCFKELYILITELLETISW